MDHTGISRFLLLNAGLAEQIIQGVEPEDYDKIRDVYRETARKWDYAHYCISNGAICDIDRGTNNLPTTIQGYDIGGRVPCLILSSDTFTLSRPSASVRTFMFVSNAKAVQPHCLRSWK